MIDYDWDDRMLLHYCLFRRIDLDLDPDIDPSNLLEIHNTDDVGPFLFHHHLTGDYVVFSRRGAFLSCSSSLLI